MRLAAFPLPATKYFAHPALALGGLALFIVLSRLPFNLNTGADEAFYLILGRQWLEGAPPYAGSFDVKPPLLFLLMAGAEALFGPTVLAAKALGTAAAVLTGWGLYLFGLRYLGALAGAVAAILFTFAAVTLGATFSSAEAFMAPLTAFAMTAGFGAVTARRRLPIAALLVSGLLTGAAASVKHTAVFSAAPLVLALLLSRQGASRVRAVSAFAFGSCIFPGGFALYFLAIGHFGDFFNGAVLTALLRAGAAYRSWGGAFGLLMGGIMTVLPVLAMAGVFWAERRPFREQPFYPAIQFVAAWAAGAAAGVFVTREMSIVYALPLMLPLSLAAGGFVQHVLGRIQAPGRRWLSRGGAVAAALLYSIYISEPMYFEGAGQLKAAEDAANLMRREGLRPGDRIFVVDRDLLVYLTAGAEPPFSVFHPLHLLCPFPLKEAQSAWADSMDAKPAFVVIADPPVSLVCEDPARREAIKARLSRDYCRLGRFDSSATAWPGTFTVFGLKERLSTRARSDCGGRYSLRKLPPDSAKYQLYR